MLNRSDSRNKILFTAANLFQKQGYHATGLNQIIKESGAPKGSIYHYFPGGKEELAIESIRLTQQKLEEYICKNLSSESDPIQAIYDLLIKLAAEFSPDDSARGISISLLALETALLSEPLRKACQDAVEAWESIFTEKLLSGGFNEETAKKLSMTIHLLIEGAITLSLTKKTTAPFQILAEQIKDLLTLYRAKK